MQALSATDHHWRSRFDDPADSGLGRRLSILFGVSWGVVRGISWGPARGISWDCVRERQPLVAALASLLMAGSAMVPAVTLAAGYDPASDMNSMYNTTRYTGVTTFWNAGFTGAGIDIALIDTGVSPVTGLDGAGKIIDGPDVSFESQNSELRYLDTNGHGTFMAGIIAGKDSTLTVPYSSAPASAFRGVAPDARIVSLKVGVADGGVDVSQVIAAIDWVVQHKNDNGMNIRVLSLSYGTDSSQPYDSDPLAFAVEQAWRKGVFVVSATGNAGYVFHTGTLTNPAFDPRLFAVGASDSMGTALVGDDTVAAFSSSGTNGRTPDIVNPGAHIVSLRVPGSYIDQVYGSTGYVSDRFFRGSGTSESAAFTAGEAALIIQQRPTITPDQLKKLFLDNARLLNGYSSLRQGAGEVEMATLFGAPASVVPNAWKHIDWSTGTGSLDASRGTDRVTDDNVVLSGEIDIFGHYFDSALMATLEAAGTSWVGGTWNGNSWSGTSWSGNSWSGTSWSGNSWSGNSWSGNGWIGNSWSGNSWSGNSWSGNSWSGNSWSGNSWSGNSWSTGSWN